MPNPLVEVVDCQYALLRPLLKSSRSPSHARRTIPRSELVAVVTTSVPLNFGRQRRAPGNPLEPICFVKVFDRSVLGFRNHQ